MKKICKLLVWKYFCTTLTHNVKAYVQGCDVCPAFKAVRHKFYCNLQSLPIPTDYWKNLLINFVTGLPISTNWKRDSYDSILVIVNRLTKMVYYKLVKIIINTPRLEEVIIDVVMRHHNLPNLIVANEGSLFTLKFWLFLCYFFGIQH